MAHFGFSWWAFSLRESHGTMLVEIVGDPAPIQYSGHAETPFVAGEERETDNGCTGKPRGIGQYRDHRYFVP